MKKLTDAEYTHPLLMAAARATKMINRVPLPPMQQLLAELTDRERLFILQNERFFQHSSEDQNDANITLFIACLRTGTMTVVEHPSGNKKLVVEVRSIESGPIEGYLELHSDGRMSFIASLQ